MTATAKDSQHIDIAAHNVRDAYARAERLGYYGPPVEQYTEQVAQGRVLQVLRFRKEASNGA